MVPPYATRNMTVGAALEYAIDVLGVKHVVVLGHYQCGAMGALRDLFGPGGSSSQGALPDTPLATWLRYAEPSYHEAVHKGVLDTEAWMKTLVEENVLQQLANAIEYPVVRRAVEGEKLKLHAWTYSLEAARLYFFNAKEREFRSSDVEVGAAGLMTLEEIEREDHVRET